MRVAIYARFSDTLQNPASVADQIREITEFCEHEEYQIVDVYTDHAITGTTLLLRGGMQRLIQDAMSNKFDAVVSESQDRLSRNMADIASLFERFRFANVQLITLQEGTLTPMHIGLKGVMNEMYITDMKQKVKRGQRGRVEEGRIGGGNCYGFEVVREFDENGELVRGKRKIIPEQAEIIRRIFQEYESGASPRAIAERLNEDDIPAPTKHGWASSTINGNKERGSGILNNELYGGEIVWNKVSYIKNPSTGKNVTRPNPPSEWVRKSVPELCIVPEELWNAVKKRQQEVVRQGPKMRSMVRPKYLLSGLMKCGCCGGGISRISHERIGCSTSRNKGKSVCSNRRTIRQDIVEHTTLTLLRNELMRSDLLDHFCKEYTRQINTLRMEKNTTRNRLIEKLSDLEGEEQRYIRAVAEGYVTQAMKDALRTMDARKDALKASIGEMDEVRVLLHPNMALRYEMEVRDLTSSLNNDETRSEAGQVIRSLIDRVVLTPDPDNKKSFLIDLHGDLPGIINIARDKSLKKEFGEAELRHIQMIAGVKDSLQFTDLDEEKFSSIEELNFINQCSLTLGSGLCGTRRDHAESGGFINKNMALYAGVVAWVVCSICQWNSDKMGISSKFDASTENL